jgi:hypothetical protein
MQLILFPVAGGAGPVGCDVNASGSESASSSDAWVQVSSDVVSPAYLAMCARKAGTRTLTRLCVSSVIQARRAEVVKDRSLVAPATVVSLMARYRWRSGIAAPGHRAVLCCMSNGSASGPDESGAVTMDCGVTVFGSSTSLLFDSGGSAKGSSRLVLLASDASGSTVAGDRMVAGGCRRLCAIVISLGCM